MREDIGVITQSSFEMWNQIQTRPRVIAWRQRELVSDTVCRGVPVIAV